MSAGGNVTQARTNPVAGFFKIEGTATALVFVVLIVVFMITAPRGFLGYRVYMSFMASVPPPLSIAPGLTLVATAGEMDLSFPSVVAFASYVFAFLFQQYDMTWLALIAALATGRRSCIYIEHNIHHVHEVCDRLVVLDRGEIALDAPTSSLTYTELTDFLMSLHKPRVAAAN